MKHLWEESHLYYCVPTNYFNRRGTIDHHDSWEEFYHEYSEADFDCNLIFRWDWQCKDNWNEEQGVIAGQEGSMESDELRIYWMGQRSGLYRCSIVSVKKEDETKVIRFLEPRFQHLKKIWQPFE